MIQRLREIILDYQQLDLPTGIPRRIGITAVPGKACVCIGVRRSGKTTLLFQVIRALLKRGVPRDNIFYLNLFDDRLHRLESIGLDPVLEAYFSIYPEKKRDEKIYCFFDEIQTIPGFEAFVDRLMRTENCEVYLSGSSARMLSREVATQLRGRGISWEVFPCSFHEYLDAKAVSTSGAMSTKGRLMVQKAFDGYWESGGFPEVIELESNLRVKIHQEYFSTLLFHDLIERLDISHPRAVKDLAHRLIDNVGSFYSINKLTGFLQSMGHRTPKASVSQYLDGFEDAFFLFTVRLYDANLARSNANPKKVYCVDHGLVRSVFSGLMVNKGHLLENLVFVALRRNTKKIFYYRTRSGQEVDFMVEFDSRRQLIHVCDTILDSQTRNREVSGLETAMFETKLDEGTIVTRREEEMIHTRAGVIHVKPAWRFLLELSI